MILKRGLLRLFLFFSLILSSWGNPLGKNETIRDPKTKCGIYLAPSKNTTFGYAITKDLSPENLRRWAESAAATDFEDKTLFAVGAPFASKEHKALITELKIALEEAGKINPGVEKLGIKSTRRIADFLHEQRGIYEVQGERITKVAAYNPADPRVSDGILKNLAARGNPLVIVGAPLFGAKRKALNEKLLPLLSEGNPDITVKSSLIEGLKKGVKRPDKALVYAAQQLKYQFPMREDLQSSTAGERSSTKKKLIVPGLLTFALQQQPLVIRIPITVVNAINSGATGVFRTFLANWQRRSTSTFPSRLFKQTMLSLIFSADLYWAGQASNVGAALTFAGWHQFFVSKWLSIVFQTTWRTPYHALVYKWEAWRNEKFSTTEDNEETRKQASALEKTMSYFMTQAFIFSLLAKDNLFAVVNSPTGLAIRTQALESGDAMLMGFNWGHALMASVGGATMLALGKPELLTPFAKFAGKIDDWENAGISKLSSFFSGLKARCVTPFSKLFSSKNNQGP